MPNVAEWSLAVIAAVFVVTMLVLIPVLWQVRRTAREAERLLAGVAGVLPDLLGDLRDAVQKVSGAADHLDDLVTAMDRLARPAAVMAQLFEQVRDALVPSVANAAGVFAALREGMQWMRPGRARGREGS